MSSLQIQITVVIEFNIKLKYYKCKEHKTKKIKNIFYGFDFNVDNLAQVQSNYPRKIYLNEYFVKLTTYTTMSQVV